VEVSEELIGNNHQIEDVDAEMKLEDDKNKQIQMRPTDKQGVWMSFEVSYHSGTGENPVHMKVPFVDFSSAGNGWSPENRYRVWIPEVYDPSAKY